jgi:hypothetical protein
MREFVFFSFVQLTRARSTMAAMIRFISMDSPTKIVSKALIS